MKTRQQTRQQTIQKRKSKRQFNDILRSIMHCNSVKKYYEVSTKQYDDMIWLLKLFDFYKNWKIALNISEWLGALTFEDGKLNGLFNNKKSFQNQMTRASILVEHIKKHDIKNIVILDGHGRMTYCLCSLLQKENLNVNITVVEYDAMTYN